MKKVIMFIAFILVATLSYSGKPQKEKVCLDNLNAVITGHTLFRMSGSIPVSALAAIVSE